MKHNNHFLLVVSMASLICLGLASAQPPKKEPTYYRLVKIDTIVDHAGEADFPTMNVQKHIDDHWAVSRPEEGRVDIRTLDNKGLNYAGATWSTWPTKGKASYRQPKPEASLEVNWTVPPEYLSSDDEVTLSISVNASGNTWGGAGYWSRPAERFATVPNSMVGKNPFDKVQAGQWSGGFVPSDRGSIKVKPVPNSHAFFVELALNPSYDFAVHYHYEPLPTGTLPPKKDSNPPKPPVTPCPLTFDRTWNTDWDKMVISTSGTTAQGTYTNRAGKFGPGTFTGTVTGTTLNVNWKDASGAEGEFKLTLHADGCGFNGTYTEKKAGSSTTPGPHGQDTSKGPFPPVTGKGGTASPDTPFDPNGQACIDEWLRLAMKIRNRRDTRPSAPGGPWHVSQYGQLIGHNVVSAQPPEGWESTYKRNRYAYVWANWQDTHKDSAYGGELPALSDYVIPCQAKKGAGGSGPGPGPTGYPPGTNPSTAMALLAEHRTVMAGDLVLLPVWLVNGADVANINFTAAYNGAIVNSAGDPVKGNLLGDALFSANAKDAGLIRLGFAQTKGLSGTGTVAYVPFRAVGKPGDRTTIHLEVTTINNPAGTVLSIARIDGSITIAGPDGLVPGDCDGDGQLTAMDAKCALDMSVKLIPEKLNLDMDGDGQVTSRDATIILQRRAMYLAKGKP